MEIYTFRRNESLTLQAYQFFEGRAHVSIPSRAAYIINFFEGTCICLGFQNCHLPCRYAITVCKDQVLDPEDFTLPVYTIDNYCNIYFKDFALDPI